jgi:alpha-mannosidase
MPVFWTEEKLWARINEVGQYRYIEGIKIPEFRFQVDEQGIVGDKPRESGEWSTIRVGEHWSGRDVYAWLETEVDIPDAWKSSLIVGLFDFGCTGGGNNSGFESLLYINGRPFQGVDSNHQEVLIPNEYAGTRIRLQFRLWSGLEGGGQPRVQEHAIRTADIALLHTDTDDLYFTAKAVLQTIQALPDSRPERVKLLTSLNRACNQIDFSRPGSDEFYQSISETIVALHDACHQIDRTHHVTVHCIGHTHIDVAWLWRLKHTREKAARSFSTVLRLMERYPEYVFLQTQPQLYSYIKNDYPELYEQIQNRVREGRWEAAGGMWLEADCNLPSGESLVRQLLLGTRFLRNEFGSECTYLWLPDVFGYSWALPQILLKSGIKVFMTTKISWNQYNRMPHDTFTWRGIDGTEILTHFITTPEPGSTEGWRYTYNGQITAETVTGIWDNYRDKELTSELLLSYGYGDGGGGVNREMLELRRRFDDMPGLPRVVTSRADKYFEQLSERFQAADTYRHTWDGELYLEYHRGTYTSQAYNKRMNRKLELLLRETEWLSVLKSCLDGQIAAYPSKNLEEAWTILLRNQFHDILPGSSIREVYEDSDIEYQQAEQIARQEWDHSAAHIVTANGRDAKTFVVFNSSPWERSGMVRVARTTAVQVGKWVGEGSVELTTQVVGDEWFIRTNNVPSMGYTTIQFHPSEDDGNSNTPFDVQGNHITTPFYEISWNPCGQLSRIYDRISDREVLSPGKIGNVLQVFEDKPKQFDAWDIDLFYQEKMTEVTQLREVEVEDVGPVRATVRFKWAYMSSTITQRLHVYAFNRRIDFETIVDWREQRQLLKVAFPVDVRATEATYDIQFGNVKRPTHWNTSWDEARFETVGHQWADLSERDFGVSLLNDCKYGYDIKDNVIRLSLIKSAMEPDYLADQGEHVFTYALLPHSGDWVQGETVQEAWDLNAPMTAVCGESPQKALSMFRLGATNIMISAVKKAEDADAVIVRLHEFTGARTKVTMGSDLAVNSWQECNLMETPQAMAVVGAEIEVTFRPYEIKTFLVRLKN